MYAVIEANQSQTKVFWSIKANDLKQETLPVLHLVIHFPSRYHVLISTNMDLCYIHNFIHKNISFLLSENKSSYKHFRCQTFGLKWSSYSSTSFMMQKKFQQTLLYIFQWNLKSVSILYHSAKFHPYYLRGFVIAKSKYLTIKHYILRSKYLNFKIKLQNQFDYMNILQCYILYDNIVIMKTVMELVRNL